MGLEASMAEHATRLMEKSNITVNLDVPETRTLNDDSIAMVLLSTYKEAVNNAVKHSGAREVWVKLRLDEGQYELEVRDDVWRGREMTRIKVTVDGVELYEYLDFDKTFKQGHFAFQQHDPGSKVNIRKVEVMPLKD